MRRQYSPQEKQRLVLDVIALEDEGLDKTEACARLGISRANFYRWRRQVAEAIKGNTDSLRPKSRCPKVLARSTPIEIRQKIVEMASSGKFKSANAIAKALADERAIHAGTVIKILEEAGLYGVIEVRDSEGRLIKKKSGIICS